MDGHFRKKTFLIRSTTLNARTRRRSSEFRGVTMVKLENDAFLTELTKLFERSREAGTVTCTMKIVNENELKPKPKGTKRSTPSLEEIRAIGSGYGVLVRATCGKRKVSTLVRPEKAAKFAKSYQTIQLAYMDFAVAETSKKKKMKAKAKAKAKAKGASGSAKKSNAKSTVEKGQESKSKATGSEPSAGAKKAAGAAGAAKKTGKK